MLAVKCRKSIAKVEVCLIEGLLFCLVKAMMRVGTRWALANLVNDPLMRLVDAFSTLSATVK